MVIPYPRTKKTGGPCPCLAYRRGIPSLVRINDEFFSLMKHLDLPFQIPFIIE